MNDEIRRVVIAEMKKQGITRYQLAKDIGVESPNISRLLNGRSGKIPESWKAIFDRLGLELYVGKREKDGSP